MPQPNDRIGFDRSVSVPKYDSMSHEQGAEAVHVTRLWDVGTLVLGMPMLLDQGIAKQEPQNFPEALSRCGINVSFRELYGASAILSGTHTH